MFGAPRTQRMRGFGHTCARGEVTFSLEKPCWNWVVLGSRVLIACIQKVVAYCMFIGLESMGYFVYCNIVPSYAEPIDMLDGTCRQ